MPFAIADSSGLVALVKVDDSTHAAAIAEGRHLIDNRTEVIVPSEVFAETVNIVGKKISQKAAIEAANTILDAGFTITGSNTELLRTTARRLRSLKASVSFIDALVMVVADQYATQMIFGFDAIFAANGYKLPSANVYV